MRQTKQSIPALRGQYIQYVRISLVWSKHNIKNHNKEYIKNSIRLNTWKRFFKLNYPWGKKLFQNKCIENIWILKSAPQLLKRNQEKKFEWCPPLISCCCSSKRKISTVEHSSLRNLEIHYFFNIRLKMLKYRNILIYLFNINKKEKFKTSENMLLLGKVFVIIVYKVVVNHWVSFPSIFIPVLVRQIIFPQLM